jgi:hypothetical protein
MLSDPRPQAPLMQNSGASPIDELQYVEENEFAALITAIHGCIQQQVPVVLVALACLSLDQCYTGNKDEQN